MPWGDPPPPVSFDTVAGLMRRISELETELAFYKNRATWQNREWDRHRLTVGSIQAGKVDLYDQVDQITM